MNLAEYYVLFVSLEECEDEWACCQEAAFAVSRANGKTTRTAFRPFRRVLSAGEDFFDEHREQQALERCNFVVFILPEFWAPAPGDDSASRLQELWIAAKSLYAEAGLRDIVLLFKTLTYDEQSDVENGPEPTVHFTTLSYDGWPNNTELYATRTIRSAKQMSSGIKHILRRWTRQHWANRAKFLVGPTVNLNSETVAVPAPPLFEYWIHIVGACRERDHIYRHERRDVSRHDCGECRQLSHGLGCGSARDPLAVKPPENPQQQPCEAQRMTGGLGGQALLPQPSCPNHQKENRHAHSDRR